MKKNESIPKGLWLFLALALAACAPATLSTPSAGSDAIAPAAPVAEDIYYYRSGVGAVITSTPVDWSGATSHDLAFSSDPTYSPCIKLTGAGSWGTSLAFENFTVGLLAKYTQLEFKVKTSLAAIKVKVPEVEKEYLLTSGTTLAGGWVRMSVPLADFDAVLSGATKIAIFGSPSSVIYLTDVALKGYSTYVVAVAVKDGSTPVESATVAVGGVSAQTNTLGVATLPLANGGYTLQVTKAGYVDGSVDVVVNKSGVSASVTLTTVSATPATLTVQVNEGSGSFASALVRAVVTVNGVAKTTGTDGKASFAVPNGSNGIAVNKSGYIAANTSTTMAGVNKTLSVTLDRTIKPSISTDNYNPGSGWSLAWSDEFNAANLDTTKWAFQEAPAGKFNNELQVYTKDKENCFVTNRTATDGVMVIQAVKTAAAGGMGDYTSARMITHPTGSFLYGKIAARIQVPRGQGLWPAFWMLGSNINENPGGTVAWPQCGEIDIMEKKGGDSVEEKTTLGTYHFWNTAWEYHSGSKTMPSDLSDDFHVYEVEWNATSITWRIDGQSYFNVDTTSSIYDEFRKNFYILLNVAVGGGFDGNPDATTTFPQAMFVDWVRVYQ